MLGVFFPSKIQVFRAHIFRLFPEPFRKAKMHWDPSVITCLRELQLYRQHQVSEELVKSQRFRSGLSICGG